MRVTWVSPSAKKGRCCSATPSLFFYPGEAHHATAVRGVYRVLVEDIAIGNGHLPKFSRQRYSIMTGDKNSC